MPGRRRSASDLPRAPLELVHPLAIPDGSPPGAELLTGGAGPYAGVLFRLHRALLDWTAATDSRPTCDFSAMRRIEDALLARLETDPVAPALAVLSGAVLRGGEADRAEVAWACLAVSDWAIERGDGSAALAFAQLAAWVWPQNARYGWLVGRLLISLGRARESETWFRRAHRVAVWADDWEGQSRALNSLGLVYFERGRVPACKRHHMKAVSIARRHGLREIEGTAAHNLFVVFASSGESELAEHWAAHAFEQYRPQHPRLAEFVADVAFFWNDEGYYRRTFPVFQLLVSRFEEPSARVRVAAGMARAAGGVRDAEVFRSSYEEIWGYSGESVGQSLLAGAMYEAGIGAANLGDKTLAMTIFTHVLDVASEAGALTLVAKADLALAKMKRDEVVDPAVERRPYHPGRRPGDRLAREFVGSLTDELPGGLAGAGESWLA